MSKEIGKGYGIAKYLIRKGEEKERGGAVTDHSRIFQLNRMEGTGLGKPGPTQTMTQEHHVRHATHKTTN